MLTRKFIDALSNFKAMFVKIISQKNMKKFYSLTITLLTFHFLHAQKNYTYFSKNGDSLNVTMHDNTASCIKKNILLFNLISFKMLNSGVNAFPIGITAKHFFNDKLDVELTMDFPLADIGYLDSRRDIPHSFYTELMGSYVFSTKEKEFEKSIKLLDYAHLGTMHATNGYNSNPSVYYYTSIKVPIVQQKNLAMRFGVCYFAEANTEFRTSPKYVTNGHFIGSREFCIAIGIARQKKMALRINTDKHSYVTLWALKAIYADIILSPGMNVILSSPKDLDEYRVYYSFSDEEFSPLGIRLGYTSSGAGGRSSKMEKKKIFTRGFTVEVGIFPSVRGTGALFNLKLPIGVSF